MGFGHWQGEIPLTKANAGRPAKSYVDRLLSGPADHIPAKRRIIGTSIGASYIAGSLLNH